MNITITDTTTNTTTTTTVVPLDDKAMEILKKIMEEDDEAITSRFYDNVENGWELEEAYNMAVADEQEAYEQAMTAIENATFETDWEDYGYGDQFTYLDIEEIPGFTPNGERCRIEDGYFTEDHADDIRFAYEAKVMVERW